MLVMVNIIVVLVLSIYVASIQVAARHLKLFGFENVTLLNTRKPTKEFFSNLIHQAEQTGVQISYDPQPFL